MYETLLEKIKEIYCERENAFVSSFVLREDPEEATVKGKTLSYSKVKCFCKCGTECFSGVLIDENKRRVDEAYRAREGIVSQKIIDELPNKYDIGIRPLSLALGWGELTYTRFSRGEYPSKEYSSLLEEIDREPKKYRELLCRNSDRITDTALKKSLIAVDAIIGDVVEDEVALCLSAYIKEKFPETTSLALQKILYYIQGFYSAIVGKNCFTRAKCFAWARGPVYASIYYLNKEGRLDETTQRKIEERRLTLDERSDIPAQLKIVAEKVIEAFGRYSGDVLKDFTHAEKPWIQSYDGSDSNEIPFEMIKDYFSEVCKNFQINSALEIQKYATEMFKMH